MYVDLVTTIIPYITYSDYCFYTSFDSFRNCTKYPACTGESSHCSPRFVLRDVCENKRARVRTNFQQRAYVRLFMLQTKAPSRCTELKLYPLPRKAIEFKLSTGMVRCVRLHQPSQARIKLCTLSCPTSWWGSVIRSNAIRRAFVRLCNFSLIEPREDRAPTTLTESPRREEPKGFNPHYILTSTTPLYLIGRKHHLRPLRNVDKNTPLRRC